MSDPQNARKIAPTILVFALLAVSGCLSTTSESGASPGPAQATFDDTTGAIEGFVGSADLLPLIGAQVGILEAGAITTTDQDGRFVLSRLAPGSHEIAVAALGYTPATRSVSVEAGQVTTGISFTLSQVGSFGPYQIAEIHKRVFGGVELKATPDCMYLGPQLKTCQGWSTQCEPELCEIHYGHCGQDGSPYAQYGCDFTPDWKTIVAEVDWIPTSSVTGRGFSLEVLAPNVTRSNGDSGSVDQSDPHDFWKIASNPPIQWTVDDAALAARNLPVEDRCGGIDIEYPNCDWVWRIFATWCTVHGLTGGAAGCDEFGPDFGLMQDQTVTVYWTYFVGEPAPLGFSAIPDQ